VLNMEMQGVPGLVRRGATCKRFTGFLLPGKAAPAFAASS
jgi:hypothetical protein